MIFSECMIMEYLDRDWTKIKVNVQEVFYESEGNRAPFEILPLV